LFELLLPEIVVVMVFETLLESAGTTI